MILNILKLFLSLVEPTNVFFIEWIWIDIRKGNLNMIKVYDFRNILNLKLLENIRP